MITISNGFLVLVEADQKGKWWTALDWQADEFLKAQRFGEMKSMGGCVQPTEITKPFHKNGCKYCFIIEDGREPCFIKNITTGKVREIKYLHLYSNEDQYMKTIKPSNINIGK